MVLCLSRSEVHPMDVERVSFLDANDVRLRCLHFGGSGPPALLLHGLCGTAEEWSGIASWLRTRSRVIAFDQRGHGKSTRRPSDLDQDAFVRDAARAIESLNLQGALVIGQSMGGRTALLLAARRADLVRALVLIESSPAKDPNSTEVLRGWLSKWPASFISCEEAERFFSGLGLMKEWTASLEERGGELRAQFDRDVMLEVVADVASAEYWDEWSRVQVPTLLIAGEMGIISDHDYTRMLKLNPSATLHRVSAAGHDVHLERLSECKRLIGHFLDDLT